MRILTWNVDGSTHATRRLEIENYLWEHDVDIAILTESHLKDEDLFARQPYGDREKKFRFKLNHYKIIGWRNRESEVVRIGGGGGPIKAKTWVDCEVLGTEMAPGRPLNCCAITVESVAGCSAPFRLTGS